MKNLKLVLHRCGIFFMIFIMISILLFSNMADNETFLETFKLNARNTTFIFCWGLFFGLSFIIFDFTKIPSMLSRLRHFILNGIATVIWVVETQTEANSKLLQYVFFAIVIYVFVYWIIHFVKIGLSALFKKILSRLLADK